ncbi:MAG: GNAT family N-acetyltransferase [Nocardioidaceae bacterium]|nr:GNAT family N-acetyltransferase [Nocardioidaceae bacterium]NUS51969.1 GNAT family N-acetyltransferase [Nocardioidaceae bacterium]
MTIVVRPAHTSELGDIGELTVRAYAEVLVDGSSYSTHLRDAATRAREAELYVALLGDDLAGTVTFCPQGSPWAEIAQPGEGEFRMLAVDPRHRRQGVAEALVSTCLERARELGYQALVLCSMDVQAPAQRIYARFGFERAPDRDWSPVEGVDLRGFRLAL